MTPDILDAINAVIFRFISGLGIFKNWLVILEILINFCKTFYEPP